MAHNSGVKTFSKLSGKEQTSFIPCPVCARYDYSPRFHVNAAAFVTCRHCSTVFQNPQPDESELLHRYDEEYFLYEIENEARFMQLSLLALKDLKFDELQWSSGRRFLDVGCATGRLLREMFEQGWIVQGVEVCAESAEYANKVNEVPVYCGTLDTAKFPACSFDVVFSAHVIEHLSSPKHFLEKAEYFLKHNGYLVVITPNIDGFQSKISGQRWRSAIEDHLTLFSKKTLHSFLEANGFEIVRTKTWGGLAQGMAPFALKYVFDKLVKPLGAGDVIAVLAKKK